MITIIIDRNQDKEIMSFTVKGHANYDEFGKDIVCASISILTQTAVLALHEVGKIDVKYEMEDGWIRCQIPDNIDDIQRQRAEIILDTMLVGIKGTLEMYPEYIKLQDEEV